MQRWGEFMILWADGFDAYGSDVSQMTQGLYAEAGNIDLVTSSPTPRTGARCCYMDSSAAHMRRVLGGLKTVVGLAQAIFLTELPSTAHAGQVVELRDANNFVQVAINIDTTGVISVWRANGADVYNTLLGTSTTAMVASAWQHVELKADFPGETLEIRLNSVTILNLSGQSLVNTDPTIGGATGETGCSQFMFRNANSGNGDRALDDMVAWDDSGSFNNDFVGDVKVFTDMPNADTADVDWTPSSGSARYAMIDEIPADDDASYDSSTAAAQKMGVTFPGLDSGITAVSAVIFVEKTRKTDAGVCTLVASVTSSGEKADGASNPLTTEYTYRWDVFETDPATSAPWDPAAAGAAGLLIERTA